MTHLEFCHWLNGYFQLSRDDQEMLDQRKIQIIYNHLNLAETISGAVEGELVAVKNQLQLCLETKAEADFTKCSQILRDAVSNSLKNSGEVDADQRK
ncbi:MAG: hypothetical protein ACYCQI_12885 [Gammaproteobacteria bacterium]